MNLINRDRIPKKYRDLGQMEYIGHGSIGTVYRINGGNKDYALKVIDCGTNENKYLNAKKEAEILNKLHDAQNVIGAIDISEIEDSKGKAVFLLEEYGISMAQYINNTDLTISGAINIVIGVAKAMQECEKLGIVHLDIQPKNIFLNMNGQVLLGDFNSSLYIEELEDNKKMRGTLAFMAPEVYRDKDCSIQSDIYSLGILMYWILNQSRIPFHIKDANDNNENEDIAIYKRLAGTTLPELEFEDRNLAVEVNMIINTLCAFEKSKRYARIDDVINELNDLWNKIDQDILHDAVIKENTVSKLIKEDNLTSLLNSDNNNIRVRNKRQIICFILDISKKNAGINTAKLNSTLAEIIARLRETNKDQNDIDINVAFLNTANEKVWIDNIGETININDAIWQAQEATGESHIGRVFANLNKYLSRKYIFNDMCRYTRPFIFYVGNGDSVDDWKTELDKISENKWFSNSDKIVITLDENENNINMEFINAFVSNDRENILTTNNVEHIFANMNYCSVALVDAETNNKYENDFVNGSNCDNKIGIFDTSNDSWDIPWDGIYDADPFATSVPLWDSVDTDNSSQNNSASIGDSRENDGPFETDDFWGGNDFSWDDDDWGADDSSWDNEPFITTGSTSNKDTANISTKQTACSNCGRIVNNMKFCPNCGTKVIEKSPELQVSKVNFSAIAPASVVKGEYSIIDVIMYEETFRKVVDDIIAQSESEVKEKKSSAVNVTKNAKIKMIISTPDFEIDDDTEEREWIGEYLDFSFSVMIPQELAKSQILFTVTVLINNIMSTRLKFTATVTNSKEKQDLDINREDVKSAFVSYAEQDKNRALRIIQGVQLIRPDMDIYMDADKLRLNKDYDYSVKKEIDYRDVFYLCWSGFARKSKQVELEWKYALKKKGIVGIEALPLELPTNCPPPTELMNKHFNDKIFIHMNKKAIDIDNDKIQINKNLYLDKAGRAANLKGKSISLTKLEYQVLECLTNNIDRTVTAETLLQYAWADAYYAGVSDEVNLRRIVSQIRKKIGDTVIETQSGLGYIIRNNEEN